jgi:predicted amidohydrolase
LLGEAEQVFTHAAYFHFTEGHGDPLRALSHELGASCPADTLIVLPEAFNLGKPYSAGPPAIPRDEVTGALQAISNNKGHAFVVGLLEDPLPTGEKPHSSVYFVARGGPRLMCHKQCQDFTGEYTSCPVAPDHYNPVIAADTTILALACMDVGAAGRFELLAKKAIAAKKPQNFICIPAAMSREWIAPISPGVELRLQITPHFKSHIVLANCIGNAGSTPSFVTDADWKVVQ